jgi:hypothetical protein
MTAPDAHPVDSVDITTLAGAEPADVCEALAEMLLTQADRIRARFGVHDPRRDGRIGGLSEAATDVRLIGQRVRREAEAASVTRDVLAEVAVERRRQDAKWGEQNHPDGTGPDSGLGMPGWVRSYPQWATDLRQAVDSAAKSGDLTWANILLEKVFESLAEQDPVKLRAELVQVAAVAAQWAQAIDRRLRGGVAE